MLLVCLVTMEQFTLQVFHTLVTQKIVTQKIVKTGALPILVLCKMQQLFAIELLIFSI